MKGKSFSFGSLALLAMQAFSVSPQGYDKQALAGWFVGINPEKVVYAINCGSNDEITDVLGITYKVD